MKTFLTIQIILFLLIFSCEKKENNPIVAKIGQQVITLKEYRLAYLELLKQPKVFDSRKLRDEFLDELIRRKLLARLARKQGLNNDEKINGLVEAYREYCLREAHYKAVIEPKIKINENELKAVYAYLHQQRKIKHLFFKQKEQAQSAYKQLQMHTPWANLAEIVFKGTALDKNEGELGWVHWDQLDYPLAMAVFKQPVGTFTKPVKSTFGYHIIFVEDMKLNPLLTEEEFKAHRQKTYKLLSAKKGQSIAEEYIENMMRPVSIRVNPEVMKIVGQKLGRILHRQPSQYDQMHTFQLNDNEVQRLNQSLWDLRKKTLALINGKPLTVEKFIFALNFVPYAQVRKSFKTALDFVIRDQVLTKEAKKMGLNKKYDFVPLKPKIYEDYLLSIKMRRQLICNLTVSPKEIESYWVQQGKHSVNDLSDSLRTFLKQEILNQKRLTVIERTLDSLNTTVSIEKNSQPIHDFYDSIVNRRNE